MNIDLDRMSRKELQSLRADVEKALATLADREKRAALEAAERAAAEHGFSLSELTGMPTAKGRAARTKSVARYRNPADPTQTWSGRGRRPDWINAALADGRALSEFAI